MKKGVPPPFVIDAVRAVDRALERAQRRMAPPSAIVLQMVADRWRPQALGVVARLGIADRLAGGPVAVSELARATETNEDALGRVLRALARDGVFAEPTPGTFANNTLSEVLKTDHPSSMRHTVIQTTSTRNNTCWDRLEDSVRTGEPVFTKLFGKDLWGYFEDHPKEAEHFHGSMQELTRMSAPLIAAAYDFGRFKSIVDIGGGSGELLATVLAAHPGLRGAVYDLEAAVVEAPETFRKAGLEARAEVLRGSFFDRIPDGFDAALMKHIAHGYSDDAIAPVLEKVRKALGPNGTLVVVEMLVPDTNDGTHPAFLDLQMLVGSANGRERTRDDFERLFKRAGLELADVIRTISPVTLLVAKAG